MAQMLLQKPQRRHIWLKRIVFGAAGAFYAWVGVIWGYLAGGGPCGGGSTLALALIGAPVVLGLIFWPIIGVLLVDVPGDLSHFFFKLLMILHYLGVGGVVLFILFWNNQRTTEELEILLQMAGEER